MFHLPALYLPSRPVSKRQALLEAGAEAPRRDVQRNLEAGRDGETMRGFQVVG